jgi:23S rRNA (cytidine1920-2'-O)/16S rRNA (cytidine1409-2'-O)-methyltransferase
MVNIERSNFRYLDFSIFSEPIELMVCDLSFISLKLILPRLYELCQNEEKVVALIKPQFEAGKGRVNRSGVVRDINTHLEVLTAVSLYGKDYGFNLSNATYSPLRGPKGNIEFFGLWQLGATPVATEALRDVVEEAHQKLNLDK